MTTVDESGALGIQPDSRLSFSRYTSEGGWCYRIYTVAAPTRPNQVTISILTGSHRECSHSRLFTGTRRWSRYQSSRTSLFPPDQFSSSRSSLRTGNMEGRCRSCLESHHAIGDPACPARNASCDAWGGRRHLAIACPTQRVYGASIPRGLGRGIGLRRGISLGRGLNSTSAAQPPAVEVVQPEAVETATTATAGEAQNNNPRDDERVKSTIECHICYDVAGIPIEQCSRGHVVCYWCRTRTTLCGSCSIPYPEAPIICLVAAKLAAEIMVPCRHGGQGCTVQLTVESKLAHERVCQWTPMACPFSHASKCPAMIEADAVVSHLRKEHLCKVIVGDQLTIESSQLRHLGDGKQCMWERSGCWYNLTICQHNKFIGSVFFVLRLCGPSSETSGRHVELSVRSGARRRTWNGPLLSAETDTRDAINNRDCVELPPAELNGLAPGEKVIVEFNKEPINRS